MRFATVDAVCDREHFTDVGRTRGHRPRLHSLSLTLALVLAFLAGCAARVEQTGDDDRDIGGAAQRTPGRAGGESRAGPRAGHAELPPLPRRDTGDYDDAGGDASSRGPATREAVRNKHRRPGRGKWPLRGPRQSPMRRPAGPIRPRPLPAPASRESDQDFERRTTTEAAIPTGPNSAATTDALRAGADPAGPLEAIALYNRLLTEYPSYKNSDQVLYQMARAYDELGRTDEAMETMERLIGANPNSVHFDEVQFRRGEYFFTRRKFRDAENAYTAIINLGANSSYYELALYKLGWTFYKQEFYEEALHKYMALLDYKVSIGYDFDQTHEEEDEKRVADTYRVISLSFSNLGGSDVVREYYSKFGNRPYEDRVYNNLGDHYLEKLRYDDAAKTFKTFVALYPFHRNAPRFSMRIVETFTKGGFPQLVLESKRDFASRYGLQAEYWQHFKPEESPEVLAYLKTNLKDLATHYHAEYQSTDDAVEKLADYHEAIRWYGGYLESFPKDADSPPINYELADLLLENQDFGEAAKQYERTAYGYPQHARSADAGYAAVYAYRQQLKAAGAEISRTPSSAIRLQARSNLPTLSRTTSRPRRFWERRPMTCTR